MQRKLHPSGVSEQARLDLLITGFGPFPTVAHNVSGDLAHAVEVALRHRLLVSGIEPPSVKAVVLPTVWTDARAEIENELIAHTPTAVLSFGVSKRAPGFSIETIARNIARATDADGATPELPYLSGSGPRILPVRIPARRLVGDLRRAGIPASRSMNAGAYLCNALLYGLIEHRALARSTMRTAAFVHLPAALVDAEIGGVPARLTWETAVRGGVMIAERMLAFASETRALNLVD